MKYSIPMVRFEYPKAGDRVEGVHVFGNKYRGTISSSRPHTMNPDLTVAFITFDEPTDLGISPKVKTGDVRTSICVEVTPPMFHGDTKWNGGSGDYFRIVHELSPEAFAESIRINGRHSAAPKTH